MRMKAESKGKRQEDEEDQSAELTLFQKGLASLKKYGIIYTLLKTYQCLMNRRALKRLPERVFSVGSDVNVKIPESDIRFSVIVPLYNTPIDFLNSMISSVEKQTYPNWELCLADGSDAAHGNVGEFCLQKAAKDGRIKYRKIEKNLGISGNTNICLEMASGDYIALFDHDDFLHPNALCEAVRAIIEEKADFIYTDEVVFEGTLDNITSTHFKPDFAIDNLRANNYICHFSCCSRKIVDKIGGFRSEYDGSQDHDFILRATEAAQKIVHIPKALYCWRSHPNSVASDISSKTYAIEAGKKAVRDHIARVGEKATVESSTVFPAIYRLQYELIGSPRVSILTIAQKADDALSKCVSSVLQRTTYDNYELVVCMPAAQKDRFRLPAGVRTEHLKIVCMDKGRHSAAFYNAASKYLSGEHFLFLSSKAEVISPDWIQEMLMYSQRSDVGAVGAQMAYPNHSLRGTGLVLGAGKNKLVDRLSKGADCETGGYMGRLAYAQNLSAVEADCMMVPRKVWEKAKGFNEKYKTHGYDVDFCLRLRQMGYLIVWTPYAKLQYNSDLAKWKDTLNFPVVRGRDALLLKDCWHELISNGDPYYNPNFDNSEANFVVKC